jgi:hypothetical protein
MFVITEANLNGYYMFFFHECIMDNLDKDEGMF